MADALSTITKIINSPLGQLAAGGVLAGFISRLFDRVENVLTDSTKFEIATWLLEPPRFEDVEDQNSIFRVFLEGIQPRLENVEADHDTFKTIWRWFGLATCIVAVVSIIWQPNSIARLILIRYTKDGPLEATSFFGVFLFSSWFVALGTHAALLVAKDISIRLARPMALFKVFALLIVYLFVTLGFCVFATGTLFIIGSFDPAIRNILARASGRVPTLPDLWLCSRLLLTNTMPFILVAAPMALLSVLTQVFVLAAISAGLALKALRRFDVGFRWFNRKFDIEKKPLSSIGLVAGTLTAIVYWTAVIVSRVVG